MIPWIRENIAIIMLALSGVSWGTRLEGVAGDNKAKIIEHESAIKEIVKTGNADVKELQKQVSELKETAAAIKEQNNYIIKQIDEMKSR